MILHAVAFVFLSDALKKTLSRSNNRFSFFYTLPNPGKNLKVSSYK